MKKFKKVLGYLILSQVVLLLLLGLTIRAISEYGFLNVFIICEGIVLIIALLMFIVNKAIDWIFGD
jgi:hypothetical protein